jgi:hypothetical protein
MTVSRFHFSSASLPAVGFLDEHTFDAFHALKVKPVFRQFNLYFEPMLLARKTFASRALVAKTRLRVSPHVQYPVHRVTYLHEES